MRTLYDVLVSHDMSLDIYDEVYDTGVCWDLPDEDNPQVVLWNGTQWSIPDDGDEMDTYDVVIVAMAKSIEAGKYEHKTSSTAYISKYVEDNLDIWRRFAQEFNGDEYLIEGNDEDSIYNGVLTIESLVIGNYCEDAYEWLVRELPAPKETD